MTGLSALFASRPGRRGRRGGRLGFWLGLAVPTRIK